MEEGYNLLHRAAKKGKKDVCASLLDLGMDVNTTTSMGWTPLHYAAMGGHKNLCTFLLDNRADIDACDSWVSFEAPLVQKSHRFFSVSCPPLYCDEARTQGCLSLLDRERREPRVGGARCCEVDRIRSSRKEVVGAQGGMPLLESLGFARGRAPSGDLRRFVRLHRRTTGRTVVFYLNP